MVESEQAARNRQAQAQMYGEPLSVIIGRIAETLNVSQARVAEVLGLSAAMLSQLCSGQRTKIGNPAVVERLRALDDLANRASHGQVSIGDLPRELEAVRAVVGTVSRSTPVSTELDDASRVRFLQNFFRAVASAEEVLGSAELLQKRYPALADLLRAYGAGRTDSALDHYAKVKHLI